MLPRHKRLKESDLSFQIAMCYKSIGVWNFCLTVSNKNPKTIALTVKKTPLGLSSGQQIEL